MAHSYYVCTEWECPMREMHDYQYGSDVVPTCPICLQIVLYRLRYQSFLLGAQYGVVDPYYK